MLLLIRFIQNATDIYSLILVAFALLSWFPNSYGTQLERFLTTLSKPVLDPLRRLRLNFAGVDFTVWVAVILLRTSSEVFIELMSKEIYQHFAREDFPFIDKGLEWLKQVEEEYRPILTPFINPHQVFILKTLGNNRGLATFSSADLVPTEYARVILAPDYFIPTLDDFEMTLLEIKYPNKFQQLTHSKILGTVLNRLGIDHKLFGDILVSDQRAQIIVNQHFATLFQDGIQKVSKLPVVLEECSFEDMIVSKNDYLEKEVLIPSFRLDAFLSSVLKISRSQATELVEKKLIQVNYHIVEKLDYHVKLGDLISVRRFGRIILLKENGQTKKDKIKVTVQLLTSK